jgi:2-(1,2-epoxy-1,2-dihydrophenyl)acetyl-CoA isomerase
MTFEVIRYEVNEGVARLTMHRPEVRNGLNEQMTRELLEATRHAAADPAVRVLALTGAGTAFCSGGDMSAGVNTERDPAKRAEQGRAARRFLEQAINPLASALYHLDKPVIAAVNGPAVGAGVGLALAADIVVAADCARFMFPFIPLVALTPDFGCTWMLPRLLGRARTLGLTMSGESLSARQAEAWGLIWRCYPDGEFPTAVAELTARLARGPALAMAGLKRAVQGSFNHDYDQQLRLEMELSSQCTASEDYAEAVAAFQSKRAPVFGGSDIGDV